MFVCGECYKRNKCNIHFLFLKTFVLICYIFVWFLQTFAIFLMYLFGYIFSLSYKCLFCYSFETRNKRTSWKKCYKHKKCKIQDTNVCFVFLKMFVLICCIFVWFFCCIFNLFLQMFVLLQITRNLKTNVLLWIIILFFLQKCGIHLWNIECRQQE